MQCIKGLDIPPYSLRDSISWVCVGVLKSRKEKVGLGSEFFQFSSRKQKEKNNLVMTFPKEKNKKALFGT